MDKEDDILGIFNKDSVTESEWLVEKSILNYPKGSIFQIMRKDFCYFHKKKEEIVLHIVPSY